MASRLGSPGHCHLAPRSSHGGMEEQINPSLVHQAASEPLSFLSFLFFLCRAKRGSVMEVTAWPVGVI